MGYHAAMRRLACLFGLVASLGLLACGGASSCEEGDVLVSGTVVRDADDEAANGAFVADAAAHMEVELSSHLADGPKTVIAVSDAPFTGLPAEYTLCGDPDAVFGGNEEYDVSAKVFNHDGDLLEAGDLYDGVNVRISAQTFDHEVAVSLVGQ